MTAISRSTIVHLLHRRWVNLWQLARTQRRARSFVLIRNGTRATHKRGYHSLFGQMLFKNRPAHCVHIFIYSYTNFTPLGPKIFGLFMATTKVPCGNLGYQHPHCRFFHWRLGAAVSCPTEPPLCPALHNGALTVVRVFAPWTVTQMVIFCCSHCRYIPWSLLSESITVHGTEQLIIIITVHRNVT